MRTLLPPKRFKRVVNLKLIEVKNDSSSEDITSAVDFTEPHELVTLPEEFKEANRADELCNQICEYLETSSKRPRLRTHLNSCRISNGLVMKENCLWVPKHLQLRTIKKMHD